MLTRRTRVGTAHGHVAAFLLTGLIGVVACRPPAEPPPEGSPKLVVLISVDQMRADYLDRFDRFWQGGFRYLADHSLRFTDAHHDHAITATLWQAMAGKGHRLGRNPR